MQTAWLQDVPLRPSPAQQRDPKGLEDFPAMMQRVLHAVNVRPALVSLLKADVSLLLMRSRYYPRNFLHP
jgi:tyrosyl-DNA phosphodiesterase 1